MTEDRKDVHQPGRVGMRSVFEWTCDACGRDNIIRPIEHVMDDDEVREMAGLNPWDDVPECFGGAYYVYPELVTCGGCGAVYETENPDTDITRDGE